MFVFTNLLLCILFKEKLVVSVIMSTSSFASFTLAEFITIMSFNFLQVNIVEMLDTSTFRYLAAYGYLFTLLLTSLVLRLLHFDIRRFAPLKRHNRYLFLLVLVGSVEFLIILFINTTFILKQNNASFLLIQSADQQAMIQLVALLLFIVMVFLFRTYLTLTINRVEEETETPYLRNINDLLTAIRSIKHDAVNHYTAISGFLKKGMYDLGGEYVEQLLREAVAIERVVETSGQVVEGIKSPAVSALLHSKMAVCLADRISFSITITTDAQFTFIKTNDLIKLLGNLLDNAIRAALQEAEEDRYICLEWSQNEKEQYLFIENSGPTIPQEKLDEIYNLSFTTKQNGEGGVGLAVVKSVIDRYGGKIVAKSDNGVTSFRITFSL